MSLERWGKLFFSKMSPLFFFSLLATPILGAALYLSIELSLLHDLEERFSRAARKEKVATDRKMRKEHFLARHTDPDPYFIDRQIESFPLLGNEQARLQALMHHPAFPELTQIQERVSFLKENRLLFVEENRASSPRIKEVEEKQRHPVQMDETDLNKILSLIEDLPTNSSNEQPTAPQLLIKDFRLKKIETPLQTELFEVEMDLIKREFSKS